MKLKTFSLLAVVGMLPVLAQAHPGHVAANSFSAGLSHPLSGWDHILAMVAVGLWAAQLGGRALWAVPLSFVGVMALGGALGMAGMPMPLVETGILISVIALGLLILTAARLPLIAAMTIVGAFALFHGFAHGAEIPAAASGLRYALGFVLATILLHGVGLAFGLGMQRLKVATPMRFPLVRFAGAAILVAGICLCFLS